MISFGSHVTFCAGFLLVSCTNVFADNWTYTEEDVLHSNDHDNYHYSPHHWGQLYPVCNGKKQSPINIDRSASNPDPHLTSMRFDHYDELYSNVTIRNTGHTVMVYFNMPSAPHHPTISGAELHGKYLLQQMHIHWGTSDDSGSEHSLEGQRYPCEMHFVHFKEKYYYHWITDHYRDDQFAVAGLVVFCEISQYDNEDLEFLFNTTSRISYGGDRIVYTEPITPDIFLPQDTDQFYRYQGSLTAPPCYEFVIWTVFTDTVKISSRQIEKMRHLFSSMRKETPVEVQNTNCRPLQPLNGRVVTSRLWKSFDEPPPPDPRDLQSINSETGFNILHRSSKLFVDNVTSKAQRNAKMHLNYAGGPLTVLIVLTLQYPVNRFYR